MRLIHSILLGLTALGSTTIAAPSEAAIIAEYDLTALTTTAPATVAATTANPGVTADVLSRGPGILPAGLTRGFSSNNWTTTGTSVNDAIAAGDYYEWGFTVNPLSLVSLTTMDFSMRRSAVAAPSNYEVQVSLDNFATPGTTVATFQYLGRSSGTAPGVVVPFQWMTTDTPGQGDGNLITPIVLSTVPSLQAIPGGTDVTFRLFGWGNIAGAADTNTVALGRQSATNGPGGPSIEGVVVTIPEPAALWLMGSALVACLATRPRS